MKEDFKKKYPTEDLTGGDWPDDDGTMAQNVEAFRETVVGRRIVKVEENQPAEGYYYGNRTIFTLDNGKRVSLANSHDCCAYTTLDKIIHHLDSVEHVILGVGTTEGFTKWHIYADLGDVMELEVGWSSGNPFYYGYGFEIVVEDVE